MRAEPAILDGDLDFYAGPLEGDNVLYRNDGRGGHPTE